MLVRIYQKEDIPQISRLYYNTVHCINSQDYTPEQINAWSPQIYEDSYWQERFQKYQVYVVDIQGIITGFSELESTGQIDCFYVHHQYQKQGVGSKLMKKLITQGKQLNLTHLFADVSITAKPFFEKRGFVVMKEQEKYYRGLYFKQFLMQKKLN